MQAYLSLVIFLKDNPFNVNVLRLTNDPLNMYYSLTAMNFKHQHVIFSITVTVWDLAGWSRSCAIVEPADLVTNTFSVIISFALFIDSIRFP